MTLEGMRDLARQGCWVCLGLLILGSLPFTLSGAAFGWQLLVWAGLAAAAVLATHGVVGPPGGGEDGLGRALLLVAGCGAMAALASPPLALGPSTMAVAWGSLLIFWHQLGTLHLQLNPRGTDLTPTQEALMAEAAEARLGALLWGIPLAGGLAMAALLFALYPLAVEATLGTMLILFAAALGTVTGFYLALKWYLHRRGASGKSG